MVKTTKGGKVMNPTDAYRKELRKKEIKRNKKERKKVREVGLLKKDPDQIKDQIQKLDIMKAEGALDKARKHKKRQLEDTLNMVMKKRKEYEEKLKEKGEEPVMFSHLGPVRHRISAEEEERANHPKPEDSVYYLPTLNPTGAPPPGKPPMYNSSIGPRVPLSEASSSSGAALSSMGPDGELPAPPPPPPLPTSGDPEFISGSDIPASLPLPPPPPMPFRLPGSNLGGSLPLPPPPPPPPGPPPREQIGGPTPPVSLAPQQAVQPLPPGTSVNESDKNKTGAPDGTGPKAMRTKNMGKRKNPEGPSSASLRWTQRMDKVFIDDLMIEVKSGNRVDGTFTSHAYDNVIKECTEKLKHPFNKDNLKNRLKTIKSNFNEVFDLFGASGWGWNAESEMSENVDEVWDSLIEKKPEARKWKTTPFHHFDLLSKLFSKDRATGEYAGTVKEKRMQTSTTGELCDNAESSVEAKTCDSKDSASQRRARERQRKTSFEKKFQLSNKDFDNVAQALREGSSRVYTSQEIFEELSRMEFDPFVDRKVYRFVNAKQARVREVFGCPLNHRKEYLIEMMTDEGV